jgi:hypothetical protein
MKITTEVSNSQIENLVVSALEGGSNYWYNITDFGKPVRYEFRTDSDKIFRHVDYPMNPGGYLVIESTEEPKRKSARLNLKNIHRGLVLMAAKYPAHYADVLNDNTDQSTADVFLQLALYGEVIYG